MIPDLHGNPGIIVKNPPIHRSGFMKSIVVQFGKFLFNCEEDARRAFSEAMYEHVDSAHQVTGEIEPVDIDLGYGHPGRPRKGELPMKKTEYRVSVKMEFDEEKARQLSQA